ncbi:MAG: sodium:solute symporter family protein [Proteobacteria bacterium]|nr:sodium:solute symporter family protein [Pseudomonadota bacterium]MBU1742341.1 sodium:solute symporter family protein [Pseudomonadota bacterium]
MTKVNVPLYAVYLGSYLAVMIGIAVYHSLKIKSVEEYLVAGRRAGFWRIVGTIIATNCGAASFIGFVGLGYKTGVNGIFFWLVPAVLFSVLFAVVFGRVLRRLNLYTIPDAFALRFGRNAALAPALFQILVFAVPVLAIQFIGLGAILKTFFGLEMKLGIIIGFAVVLAYTLLGGMPTTIMTDVIQAVILIVGLGLLFVFGIHYAGGVSRVVEITPAHYWNPFGRAGFWSFLSLALTVGPFYLVWQTTWQRIFAARDEGTAVWGVSAGMVFTLLILSLSFLIGIIARGYLPLDLKPDTVFTQAVSTVFPAAIGGLVVVGLAAALMSGADSFLMMGSASVARDIWQQYFRPGADQRQMLTVSRVSVVLISLSALVVALVGKGIIPVFILVVKTGGAAVVWPFLALMFWRRATRKGVLAGMIAGGVVTVGWHLAGNPGVMEAVPGYLSCLVALVAVSLLTAHAPDEQVKAAYFEPLETDQYEARLKSKA